MTVHHDIPELISRSLGLPGSEGEPSCVRRLQSFSIPKGFSPVPTTSSGRDEEKVADAVDAVVLRIRIDTGQDPMGRVATDLLLHAPRRHPGQPAKRFRSPGCGLVLVARSTRVRNLVLVCHGGSNEPKREGVHLDVVDGGLDGRPAQ